MVTTRIQEKLKPSPYRSSLRREEEAAKFRPGSVETTILLAALGILFLLSGVLML